MTLFTTLLRRADELWARTRSEEGQAMVEYALLISLIALAAFAGVQAFGLGVSGLYSKINAVVPKL
jgi:Flp pilus assembly pilin Flp